MFFVTPVLLVMSVIFYIWGVKDHAKEPKYLGLCFLLAAVGTGVIEYIVLSGLR